MPASTLDRIADPLVDRFALEELPRIAPWVSEEIQAVGEKDVRAAIARRGNDPDLPQPMTVWVSALKSCHGPMWEALDVA